MDERSLAVDIAYVGLGAMGNGVPATNYKQFPVIHESSVAFNFNEATMKAFKAMGMDNPWAVMYKKGDPDSIEFAIPSPTSEEMLFFCGGSLDAEGKWSEPVSTPTINKSLKLQTLPFNGKYTVYIFVNGSISARLSQAPKEDDTDLLLVKVTKQAVFDSEGTPRPGFSRQVMKVKATEVTKVVITGDPKVGTRLIAGVTPEYATGTYKWFKKQGEEEPTEIPNADSLAYTPDAEDVGCTISVEFTGTGYFSGTVKSAETTVVVA